jgi:large subunit ribosomal protein L6
MSRVAKNPVALPAGVEAKFSAAELTIKGSLGSISVPLNGEVDVKLEENALTSLPRTTASLPVPCLAPCAPWSTTW